MVKAPSARKDLDEKLTQDEREAFYDLTSDRTIAIVLGAMFENHLTSILRLLMRREKALADEMFNPSGPLGAFGTKIKLSYLLRMVSEETYKDLIIINKIRNRFAHDLSVKTLEDQQVRDWIKNMHMYSILIQMPKRAKEEMDKAPTIKNRAKYSISTGILLSMKETYRECVRYMLHLLSDYEESILATEKKLNEGQPQPSSP